MSATGEGESILFVIVSSCVCTCPDDAFPVSLTQRIQIFTQPKGDYASSNFGRPHQEGNDRPAVARLYGEFKKEDWIDPWLDTERLLPGQRWDTEIREAVRVSDCVIICLSRESINKEDYVQKEIIVALNVADEKPEGTIYIIPLKLEECSVPRRLWELQWVNYFEKGGFEKLLLSLKKRAYDLGMNVKLDT